MENTPATDRMLDSLRKMSEAFDVYLAARRDTDISRAERVRNIALMLNDAVSAKEISNAPR